MAAEGPPVRGTCKRCEHVVETNAPAGLVTWRGPCPECGERVIARLARDVQPQVEAPVTTTTARGGVRVRRVKGYRDDGHAEAGFTEPAPDDAAGDVEPAELVDAAGELTEQLERDATEPDGGGGPAGLDGPGAEETAEDGPAADDGTGRRRRRRWAGRRARGTEPGRDAAGELIPGIY